MKKLLFKRLSITAVFAALVLSSCSSNDDPNPIAPEQADVLVNLENGILNGTLEEGAVSLNASTVYELTGQFIVADGATLNIPAGTRILA
ncbi:MAG TPA: hypothetical protein VKZ97_08805, partial [Flavobacteriaceae bacterium]|nr:hypothetical protein [Flavobacteriaceae bacterium]